MINLKLILKGLKREIKKEEFSFIEFFKLLINRLVKETVFFLGINFPKHWVIGHEYIRVTVRNKNIDFKDCGCYRDRFISTKKLTLAAFKHRKFIQGNYRFWIYTGDRYEYVFYFQPKNKSIYYFVKKENPYPCYSFYDWTEANLDFERDTKILAEVGHKKPTIQKAFWIGNVAISSKRKDLVEIGKKRPDLFDIQGHNFSLEDKREKNFVPLTEHYRWSVLIDIEGWGYSGRRKYLFYSRRPLLIVEYKWKEFWEHGIKPMVHYVPVKSDLSDLVEKTELLLNDSNLRKEIAENAFDYARENITRELAYQQIESVFKHAKQTNSWIYKIMSRFPF